MRFIVKTDNDLKWSSKLKQFGSVYHSNKLTVDLNSWHAFVVLGKVLKTAPTVYANTQKQSLPIIDFRKNAKK